VIQCYERKVGNVEALKSPEIQKQIAAEVTELTRPLQAALEGVGETTDISKVVAAVTSAVAEKTISIPRIVVLPKKQITFHFDTFDVKDLQTINLRPISDELLVETMRTGARQFRARTAGAQYEMRPEDYIVRYLIEQNEIDYDAHADLLYKLSGQVIGRIRSYLTTDAEVENVLVSHGRQLAEFVFAQMMQHYRETPLGSDDYEIKVTHGFTLLRPQPFNVPKGHAARDFKQAVTPASETKRHVFMGFSKCCYPLQRFDSDPERRFAVLADGDKTVEKWMKPGKGQFQINYRSGEDYEPDFVVETKGRVLICEVKARSELNDPIVLAKAQAAIKWCEAATRHAAEVKAKPWSYLLIPDDAVMGAATLDGLVAGHTR
jgi:type III restriction enzyme